MSRVLDNLKIHNLELPNLQSATALFKPFVVSGDHVYISGQLPLGFGDLKNHIGQLGKDCDIERAKEIARICGLNVLFHLQNACGGDLDKVRQCVKLTVFVNSSSDFVEHPQVANAVSDLLLKAFGDKGNHARSAIGVSQLPFGVAVEVEAIFQIYS